MLRLDQPAHLQPGEIVAVSKPHTSELEWSLTISGHGLLSLCEQWRQAHEVDIGSDWLILAIKLDGAAMLHFSPGVIDELLLLSSIAEAHADPAGH